MDATSIGLRVKELRVKAGLSQAELAERAGIGQRTISSIEQGVNSPTFLTIAEVAKVLGVTCDAFTEPPATEEPTPRGRPKKTPAEEPPKKSSKPKTKKKS